MVLRQAADHADARGDLEAAEVGREARPELQNPVKARGDLVQAHLPSAHPHAGRGGGRPNEDVVAGVVETMVQRLGEEGKHSGQVDELLGRGVHEAGAVPPRCHGHAVLRTRSVRDRDNKVVGDVHKAAGCRSPGVGLPARDVQRGRRRRRSGRRRQRSAPRQGRPTRLPYVRADASHAGCAASVRAVVEQAVFQPRRQRGREHGQRDDLRVRVHEAPATQRSILLEDQQLLCPWLPAKRPATSDNCPQGQEYLVRLLQGEQCVVNWAFHDDLRCADSVNLKV
mmetsp:Transcript_17442/g.55809  ORF Transcript_17442/g.55809 Transcript_17442/m.55809 type:complete len:283 (-) Transcript_17442:665-1513(-)